jgi:shikimate 5-dehydrogenase
MKEVIKLPINYIRQEGCYNLQFEVQKQEVENTINKFKDKKTIGYNTDYTGFGMQLKNNNVVN